MWQGIIDESRSFSRDLVHPIKANRRRRWLALGSFRDLRLAELTVIEVPDGCYQWSQLRLVQKVFHDDERQLLFLNQ